MKRQKRCDGTWLWVVAALLLMAAMADACRNEAPASIPRRQAFPRINLYDTAYVAVDGLAVHVEVNASAPVSVKQGKGFDINYPRYGAVVYCSVTQVPDSASALRVTANRTERMALNVGDLPAQRTQWHTANGFAVRMLEADGATQTPLQFVARGADCVVSGAMFFGRAVSSADSVRPMVEAVRRDMIHMLNAMR